jgi:phosphatidylinositol alpha-mannosyltransferase
MAEAALGGSYRVLYNGIEIDRVQAVAATSAEAPTILFIGRHEPRKGLDVLLASMALLPGDTRLWVAGEGPDTRALRAQYATDGRITWLGRITEDEKLARLRGADVFCAPSLRGESFGIVLLEAMAAGTAIVASDLPGYSNVARAGLDAALVPPGDEPALAAALLDVLTDPARRAALVANGAVRAEQFSMDRLADAYLECYRDAIELREGNARVGRRRARALGGVRVRGGMRR